MNTCWDNIVKLYPARNKTMPEVPRNIYLNYSSVYIKYINLSQFIYYYYYLKKKGIFPQKMYLNSILYKKMS